MSDETKLALKELTKTFKRLQEAVHMKKSEIVRDGVIWRFKFTFGMLWKTLKITLQDVGLQVQTPEDSFREAFRLGWIQDEEAFLEMLETRNKMPYLYDGKEASQIYKKVTQRFIMPIRTLLETLEDQQR